MRRLLASGPTDRSARTPSRTGRAAVILACLLLSGCGGAAEHDGDEGLQAELRLSPTPPMAGAAGVRVRATDGGEPVVPPGAVTVTVEGVQGPVESLRFEDGAWVGDLDFPAAGEVRVVVGIFSADGRAATLAIPVRVVRRP